MSVICNKELLSCNGPSQLPIILPLGQATNMCSYIRHFNVLILILEDKKRAESMLKDNATTISEADNMLF